MNAECTRSRSAGVRGLAALAALLAGALIGSGSARADDRRFTFVDESRTTIPQHFEFEHWFTWKTHLRDDHGFNRFEFKPELEYGITDRFQAAVDLAEWHFQTGNDKDGPRYDVTAFELKYRFLDAVTDPVGLALKEEFELGREGAGLESRLIVDKIIDRWDIAWNLKLEAEWGGPNYFRYSTRDAELVQSFGASYEINRSVFVGGEIMHEIPLPNWHRGEKSNLFAGPNVSFRNVRGGEWAVTTTGLFRATGGPDEPLFQLRVIFEIDF